MGELPAAATPWRRASVAFKDASGSLHSGAVRASGQHAPTESAVKVFYTTRRHSPLLRMSGHKLKERPRSVPFSEGAECH